MALTAPHPARPQAALGHAQRILAAEPKIPTGRPAAACGSALSHHLSHALRGARRPNLTLPDLVARGAQLYTDVCLQQGRNYIRPAKKSLSAMWKD